MDKYYLSHLESKKEKELRRKEQIDESDFDEMMKFINESYMKLISELTKSHIQFKNLKITEKQKEQIFLCQHDIGEMLYHYSDLEYEIRHIQKKLSEEIV